MQNKRSIEIKVGIVSLIALILLIVGIMLGRSYNLGNSNQIILRFPNSGGLQISNPVMVNGVKRGVVSRIENNNNSVLIYANIDNINDIFSDASAKITILELTGGKKVEISPGISKIKIDTSKEIIGETSADFSDLIYTFGILSEDISKAIVKFDTVASSINTILADGTINNQIRTTLENIENTSSEMQLFVTNNKSKLNEVINDLKIVSSNLKTIINQNEPQVSKIINNIDNRINELTDLISKADSGISNIDKLAINLNSITNDVKSGNGLLNKLIYNNKFSKELDTTIKSLNILINKINTNGLNANVRLGSRD